MHIAIDVSPLYDANKARGVGFYAQHLIDALQKFTSPHRYTFFRQGEHIPQHIDLVHYPYFDPFFRTLPLWKKVKTVVTVHDLIPLAFPKHFPVGVKGKLNWYIQRHALQKANAVITDSHASETMLSRYANISGHKIYPIYLAPDAAFYRDIPHDQFTYVKKNYNLPEHYILYVGDINWNKNISGLLQSYAKALSVSRDNERYHLVLVGKSFLNDSLGEMQVINSLIASLGISSFVHKIGFIPQEDLIALYTSAIVYIQPSFAEGFGLPVLEAMTCGCPVVSAKGSSLDEISGPSVRIDPYDIEDMTQGILDVIQMRAHDRSALGEKGKRWSQRFTWQKVAKATIQVYETTGAAF